MKVEGAKDATSQCLTVSKVWTSSTGLLPFGRKSCICDIVTSLLTSFNFTYSHLQRPLFLFVTLVAQHSGSSSPPSTAFSLRSICGNVFDGSTTVFCAVPLFLFVASTCGIFPDSGNNCGEQRCTRNVMHISSFYFAYL